MEPAIAKCSQKDGILSCVKMFEIELKLFIRYLKSWSQAFQSTSLISLSSTVAQEI